MRRYLSTAAALRIVIRGWFQFMPRGLFPGALASRTDWRSPADIKAAYASASFLANNRVVFNIKGNDYRLVTAVHYKRGIMFIRFVGTHREYDRIDSTNV